MSFPRSSSIPLRPPMPPVAPIVAPSSMQPMGRSRNRYSQPPMNSIPQVSPYGRQGMLVCCLLRLQNITLFPMQVKIGCRCRLTTKIRMNIGSVATDPEALVLSQVTHTGRCKHRRHMRRLWQRPPPLSGVSICPTHPMASKCPRCHLVVLATAQVAAARAAIVATPIPIKCPAPAILVVPPWSASTAISAASR